MNRMERAQILSCLREKLSRRQVMEMIPMSHYTTLKLGGPADILTEISSVDDLRHVYSVAREYHIPVTVLGKGSNLLVRDGGIRGICIHFGDDFSSISAPEILEDGQVKLSAQSGSSLIKLSNTAADEGLSGLEFAGGIPGSVGGAIFMNAGAYGGEMKDCVIQVQLLREDGTLVTKSAAEMHFSYRHSALMDEDSNMVVLSADVALTPGDTDTIHTTMREFNARRREKQPINLPSCGSTFKRPEGQFAGTLISECGLKGFRVGGCSVSTLHAGFLVNDADGTAENYEELINEVTLKVQQKTGVLLVPEVRIIGEKCLPEE